MASEGQPADAHPEPGTYRYEGPGFGVRVTEGHEGIALVELRGEVDIYTAGEFREIMSRLIDGGVGRIILDTLRVSFMDSTALGVCASAERRLRPNGVLLIVCGPRTGHLFELTGLDRVLSLYETQDEAWQAARLHS